MSLAFCSASHILHISGIFHALFRSFGYQMAKIDGPMGRSRTPIAFASNNQRAWPFSIPRPIDSSRYHDIITG